MKVVNVHEREFGDPPARVGALLDSLASDEDALWPVHSWPGMKFDRPLGIGAVGGHGPVRYYIEEYEPGRSIKFRFTGPRGFDGYHGYEVLGSNGGSCVLRHTLEMKARGWAMFTWPLLFRPLHDALIEDSLAMAQSRLGREPLVKPWSLWVRFLRRLMSRGRASSQTVPSGGHP